MLKYTSQFAGLDIIGKDLSLEGDFIDKVKKNLYELNIEKINLVDYIWKAVMSVTFEGESWASYEDTIKIIMLIEETFAWKENFKKNWLVRKLYAGQRIQWNNSQVCFSFVYVNHSPNCRAQGDHIVEFEPCKCCSCKQSDALYTH